jgi:hypothetical protein
VNHCHTADCATQSAHQTAIPQQHTTSPHATHHPTILKAPSFAKTLHQNNSTESHHVPVPKSSQTIMPIAGKFVNKSLRKRREYAVMRLFWT